MEILDAQNLKQNNKIEYASFGNRLLAGLVDFLVMIIPMSASIYFSFIDKNLMIMLGCTIIGALYKPLMEGTYSATLGKMAVGIKMVDSDHNNLDLITSFTKNGLYLISSVIGIISAFWMFGQEAFLEADGFMESSLAIQQNPYQTISSIWSFVILISCMMMLGSDTKQTLHDRIANTYCIRKA